MSGSVATTIGKYRLIAELGSGGMASVYLAVMRGQSGFNKLVVLKVPRDTVTKDANLLAMFLDEARIAARLSHPNVVQTFEVITEGGRHIIVMEYLDGYTLNEAILRGAKVATPLPAPLHLKVIRDALTGLHYAHEAKDFDGTPLNLVHRDISPHNLFVTFDGQVKVLDFGIAKAAVQTHQTEFGTYKGKIRYMPVEQLGGSGMDRRTDIFAFGVMIWEATVGERLWRKHGDVEVMAAIIAGEIPMPKDIKPDVPDALNAICRRALAKEKTERYATCLALQADIDAYLSSLPERATIEAAVAFLEKVFAEPREERRRVVEAQLKQANILKSDEYTPLAALPSPSLNDLPTLPLIETSSKTPSIGALANQRPRLGPDHTPTNTNATGVSMSEAPPRGPARATAILVVVAAVLASLAVVAGITLVVARKLSTRSAAREAATTTAAPIASATSSATEPASAPTAAPSTSTEATAAVTTATVTPPPPPTVAAKFTPSTKATATGAKAPPNASAAAAAPPPATAAPSEGSGFVSFNTYPWTRVSLNGKALGTTPLYRVALPAGTHVLTLENPDEGVKTTYTVTVKSGESVTRSVALK